jgi:tRNA threonylcarbamoyladenosine biosynthesis protein TsaE
MITKIMKILRERSESAEQTRALGARLAKIAAPGDVYSFDGDLGSGKTEFVRGFVEALALREEDGDAPTGGVQVRSPTFSIVNTYQTPKFPVHHFDFYRIENPKEFVSIGLDEYITDEAVCLIEWGTMFPEVLPAHTKHIHFSEADESVRVVEAHFLF